MTDKKGPAPAGGTAAAGQPDSVRNVALVGHSGSGKTTLVEALLAYTGAIQRAGRVEDGSTVSDFDEVEVRQQRSVNLTLAPVLHAGVKVNLLDTPGYADFTGDLRAGLRAADAALFTVPATDGVDGLTQMLWEECARVGMPRAVVITKLDHQRADFDEALRACQDAFGDSVAPLYLPVTDGPGQVRGLIGLLTGKFFDYSGGSRTERDPDPAYAGRTEELRGALIEGIIQESEDETLMDRYLSGEDIDPKVLIEDLEKAVARGSFYPVLAASSFEGGVGFAELLEVMTQAFPAPAEHPMPGVTTLDGKPVTGLTSDPKGPLLAEVIKTTSDPYVGRISLVRLFSGTLRPDATVHVSGHGMAERGHADHDSDERIGALTSPLGKQQRPVAQCAAGDICAVAKLGSAETGDTLSDKDRPLLMEPDPLLPVAITAKSKADEDKMSQAISRLVAEDPTLRMENNSETRQLVLWCMGEAHSDLLLDRLSSRYGVGVETKELRVPLRETVAGKAQGMGRNVKQTGGHGEYGVCHIEIEPMPSGDGFEFVDKVVGGVVPRQFIPSVEKGVRAQLEQGVLAGYPMVDVRVTLFDGKAHSVDSSDMAFQKAGKLALRDAADKAKVLLLEPVDELSILVADEYVGAVMSDLSSRRGRVLGTEPVAGGRTLVKAEVPQLEITRYAIDLRSMSHGTGSFSRSYLRYEPLPSHLAGKMAKSGDG
jgi:elongation factor G